MYIRSDAQAIAHHPLIGTQPAPQAVEESSLNCHPFQNSFCMMSYGTEYPFGQFQSALVILFPPSILSGLDSVQHCLGAVNISEHQCIIKSVFLLELKT